MEEQVLQESDLRALFATLQRRKSTVIVSSVVVIATAILFYFMSPRVYEANSEIDIKTPATNNNDSNALLTALQIQPDVYKQTQIKLIQNPWMYDLVAENLKRDYGIEIQPTYKKTPGEVLADYLSVKDDGNTELAEIYADDKNPFVAQAEANEMVVTFRDYLLGVERDAYDTAVKMMMKRVKQSMQQMELSTARLADFQRQSGILDMGELNKQNIADRSATEMAQFDLARQLQGAQSSMAAMRSLLARQNQMLREKGLRSNTVAETLQAQLETQKQALADANQLYVGNPDAIKPLQAAVDTTEAQIGAQVGRAADGTVSLPLQDSMVATLNGAETDAARLESAYAQVQRQLNALAQRNLALPALERVAAQLNEDATVAQDIYQKTLEGFGQIDMNEASQPSVIQITGLAKKPKYPRYPSGMVDLGLGIVLGLLTGLGLALLQERLDDSVRNEREAQQLLPNIPILGSVPEQAPEDTDVSSPRFGSRTGDPYRVLWSNYLLSDTSSSRKTLMLTSVTTREGKSTTCACIARAAAEEKRQVIIVDCDLRRPRQHSIWNVSNQLGVVDAVMGRASLSQVLKPTALPNLHVIPAGRELPLNPPLLLRSPRMMEFVQELCRQADLIIFDVPPALGLTDALIVASWCDAAIQVVEAGRVPSEQVRRVADSLIRSHAKHSGVVLNKVKRNESDYYGYYYYYYTSQTEDDKPTGGIRNWLPWNRSAAGASRDGGRRTRSARKSRED